MSFENFVREFADWFSASRPAAVLVGIRADESLNRFITISSQRKQRFADDKPWTTSAPGATRGTSTLFMTGKPPISGPGLPKADSPITRSMI
jgi:predicted phosphoadenosine phosphosulfate sulfurtransferase